MSLKVLGRWKRMGKSLNDKFLSIQTNLQNNHQHSFHDAASLTPASAGPPKPPADARVVHTSKTEDGDPDADEDDDDGPMYDDSVPILFNEHEKDIIRRVIKKWWRLAGFQDDPMVCDELGGKEFVVNWTKAIAPRLEGRIKEVGVKA
jgi:5'-nucleotidase